MPTLQGRRPDGRPASGLVDVLARTAWFFGRDRSFRYWSFVLLASLVFEVATLPTGNGLVTGVSSVLLALAVVQWQRDWARKSRESEALKLFPARRPVADTSYEAPYSSWPVIEVELQGLATRAITNPELNRRLRSEEQIRLRLEGAPWHPDAGPAREMWELWGGRRRNLNETKIRLASDLLEDTTEVRLQVTDYNSYIVTNNLALEEIRVADSAALRFEQIGLNNGRIANLARSRLSNHLGGDLLVIEPGHVRLQLHSRHNKLFPEHWAPSASGSFDADRDLVRARHLVELVKLGLAREATEEMGLGSTPLRPTDIRVLGYARATYTGGKPQFYGVARAKELTVSSTEIYARGFERVEFSPEDGLDGIVAALLAFEGAHDNVTPPLRLIIRSLRTWADTDPGAEAWVRRYWP